MPTAVATRAAPLAPRLTFPAVVTHEGPNAEADPGVNRYWVRELGCNDSVAGRTHADGCPMVVKTGGLWVVAEDIQNGNRALAVDGTAVVIVHRTSDRQTQEKPRYFFCPSVSLQWETPTAAMVSNGSGTLGTAARFWYWETVSGGAWGFKSERRTYWHLATPRAAGNVKIIAFGRGVGNPGRDLIISHYQREPDYDWLSLDVGVYFAFALDDFDPGTLTWGSQPTCSSDVQLYRNQVINDAAGSNANYAHQQSNAILTYARWSESAPAASPVADDVVVYGFRLTGAVLEKYPSGDSPTSGDAYVYDNGAAMLFASVGIGSDPSL
jgi:hypothetical protein